MLLNIPLIFFLICGILSSQNNYIVKSEEVVGVTPSVLNFNYKLFVEKHVIDIVIHTITAIDETSLGIDKDMLNVTPLPRSMRSNILKVLIHKAKAMYEIIVMSIVRKSVV